MNLTDRVWRKANFTATYREGVLHKDTIPTHRDDCNVACSDLTADWQSHVVLDCASNCNCCRAKRMHMPVLDLDVPATLLPSSTPGHSHLFLDRRIFWDDYVNLLDALAACGLVEAGYVRVSKARGYTAVRLPWVRKLRGERDCP